MTHPSHDATLFDYQNPVVAVDASRNRSGGARAHLIGLLCALDPRPFGIQRVHVWSYKSLLTQLPDRPWLVKHGPGALEKSVLHQMLWQKRSFPTEIAQAGCNILLSTSAGTVARFSPSIVMSRDMLSFEPGEMERFPWSLARLRLVLLRHIQVRSLREASGALFLTKYAASVIRQHTGPLALTRVIPHGLGSEFRREHAKTGPLGRSPRCVYVSNSDFYKHQWNVVDAVSILRRRGHDVSLDLVGAGSGRAAAVERLTRRIHELQAQNFVRVLPRATHREVPAVLQSADIFIFASSCENMPNTLIEAMAAGLPIACSNRGPMPEVLDNGGVYFDPEQPASIATAVEALLTDEHLRDNSAAEAHRRSHAYSWERCARETWSYIREVYAAELANDRIPPTVRS